MTSKEAIDYRDRIVARLRMGWTQGTHARDCDGRDVPPISDLAVCWCIDGAIIAEVERNRVFEVGNPLCDEALRRGFYNSARDEGNFVDFNDAPGRTLAEVIEFVKAAFEPVIAGAAE